MDKIAIIGLGYVGLPLAVEFAKKYSVVGFDIFQTRIDELNSGFDRTLELDATELKHALEKGIVFSTQLEAMRSCNIFIVTVPTPIDKSNRPDLTPLIKASQSVGKVLKKDDIVIYESTVYPGVTEEVCVPVLEEVSGLVFNVDFYAGYSPERINPGDKNHTLKNILKVTSGSTPEIANKVDALYRSIIVAGTHKASSIKVAEASKVIENTQRDVNIALINELALIFNTMGIDTQEVLEAAATKWNFIKLKPGLVGGHCIGVDPYYLTHKAEELGYKPNLILGARQINNSMGKYIADKTIKLMIENDTKIKDANILILGLTFKENCPDIRNTKVVDIVEELETFKCHVEIYDPWVDRAEAKKYYGYELIDDPFLQTKTYEAIIVAVGHNEFAKLSRAEYQRLSHIIVDVKGIVENPTWRL